MVILFIRCHVVWEEVIAPVVKLLINDDLKQQTNKSTADWPNEQSLGLDVMKILRQDLKSAQIFSIVADLKL